MAEKNNKVALVGLSPAGIIILELLARQGLSIRVIDRGRVKEEDIKSATLFYEEDITKFKVKEAKKRLSKINAKINMKSFHEEVSKNNIFLVKSDVCIDASNSTEVNEITTDYCIKNKVPLVALKLEKGKAKVLVARKRIAKKTLEGFMKRKEEEIEYDPSLILAAAFGIAGAAMGILSGNKKSFIAEIDPKQIKAKVKAL